MAGPGGGEPQYFSKDFDFEDLRRDVEADAAYHHHVHPYRPPPPSSPPPPDTSSQAWTSFHKRHITGRFFKVIRYIPVFFFFMLVVFLFHILLPNAVYTMCGVGDDRWYLMAKELEVTLGLVCFFFFVGFIDKL